MVVIDCTEIGWSLPTPTLPTLIWRVLRRGASTGGGAAGIPRLTAVMAPAYGAASVGGTRSGTIRRRRLAGSGQLMVTGTTRSPTISTTPITSRKLATT